MPSLGELEEKAKEELNKELNSYKKCKGIVNKALDDVKNKNNISENYLNNLTVELFDKFEREYQISKGIKIENDIGINKTFKEKG